MTGLGFYLLLLLVVFTIVMFIRIKFDVSFSRKGSDDYLSVRMTALKGLVSYKTEVPVIDIDRFFLEPILRLEADIEHVVSHPVEDKGMLVKIPVIMLMRNMPTFIRQGFHYVERYNRALNKLVKSIRCHDLKWKTEVGLGDPAYTGMASGLVWGVKGLAYGIFRSSIGEMKSRPLFDVRPCFDAVCLRVDFRCIFDLRVGHIIIAGLKFVKMRLWHK